MDKLAATAVFTAQGIPFIHEGQEFLRTKKLPDGSFDANSYMSSDEVNGIDWDMKTVNSDVYNYYKGLIALRKAHPAFRMANAAEIRKNLKFIKTDDDNLIAYKIVTDNEKILVALNGAKGSRMLKVPSGRWHVYSDGNKSSAKPIGKIHGGKIVVPAYSALVIGKPNFDKLRNAAIATGVVVAAGVAVKLALSSDNKQIKEFRKNAEKEALYAAGKAVKFTGKAVKSLSEDKSVKALRNLFDEKFKF